MNDSDSPAEYRALAADGGVHVWQGSTRDAPPAAALRLLSAAERTVMRRRPRTEGLRYAGAHITVRQILSRYLGVPAAGLRFGTRPCPWCADPGHGRPVVAGPPDRPRLQPLARRSALGPGGQYRGTGRHRRRGRTLRELGGCRGPGAVRVRTDLRERPAGGRRA